MKYKHTLDPTPRKFPCPSCGKKRFVRYINTQSGEYLPQEFGRCDRETSCTYHHKPNFSCHPERSEGSPPKYQGKNLQSKERLSVTPSLRAGITHETRTPQPDFIPFNLFRQTLPNQTKNHFVQYLKTLFPRETVKKLIIDFFIGASNHWTGATIFWQIDKNANIRSGQVMLYDRKSGKRIKDPYPHITWAHTILLKKGILETFNLKQCLFGEHQLIDAPSNKPVAIVESAKSAIIMTGIFPDYLWMATNGSHNINSEFFNPLKKRIIILYPDLGQFKKWNVKATYLQKQGFKIAISNLLEKTASPLDHANGLDIADYFINYKLPLDLSGGIDNRQPSTPYHEPRNPNPEPRTSQHPLLTQMVNKYPKIQDLISALDLII